MLCGLVGRDSRLSKLPLLRSSGGVEFPVVGRSIGDDPSALVCLRSCSGCTKFSDDRPTADVSIVIVGALGRRLWPPGGGEDIMAESCDQPWLCVSKEAFGMPELSRSTRTQVHMCHQGAEEGMPMGGLSAILRDLPSLEKMTRRSSECSRQIAGSNHGKADPSESEVNGQRKYESSSAAAGCAGGEQSDSRASPESGSGRARRIGGFVREATVVSCCNLPGVW